MLQPRSLRTGLETRRLQGCTSADNVHWDPKAKTKKVFFSLQARRLAES